LIQLQAAKAFAALNSAANAGIRPHKPVAKMDAGQDSSSSDNKQEEAQDKDRKSNNNKQEEALDNNKKLDKKNDNNKSLVDDANEDDYNANAAVQTDNNSADAILKIIDIDISNDTGKVGPTDSSTDDSKGGNAKSAKSKTKAGHDNVEAAESLLEDKDSNSDSCATMPDVGTSEEA
jgi:hypothetical protein